MLTSASGYDVKMIDGMGIDDIKADEITEILGQYLSQNKSCYLTITDDQKARIKIVREHCDFIEKLIVEVDTYVDEMVQKYDGQVDASLTFLLLINF